MKKLSVLLMIAVGSLTVSAFAGTAVRVVESAPGTNAVLSIPIVRPSLLKSVYCDVSSATSTNIYTISYTSAAGETRLLAADGDIVLTATPYADSIVFFNYDSTSTTGATEWLRQGDTFKITGTGSGSGATQCTYRVVFEELTSP